MALKTRGTLETLKHPAQYLKAILAALIAGLSSLTAAIQDGPLTGAEWLAAVLATLIAFNAVFFAGNKESE